MTTPLGRATSRALVPAAALLALTACTSNAESSTATISVTSSADACEVSPTTASAGSLTFAVKNDGDAVTEFYLYAENGTTIVSEVENIGPGTSRNLVVSLDAGTYVTACVPGMEGDGIRGEFTVTADGATAAAATSPELDAATADYLAYVRSEIASLSDKTDAFVAAIAAGDLDGARDIYPRARMHWERIEPIAESFGDLDPRLDLREADLGADEEWTGWHRLEKYLWPPSEGYNVDDATLTDLADQLVADTADLRSRVDDPAFELQPHQLGNGAKELLDEVAGSKITGEEEIWSGTDLWDIQANVDGAYAAYDALRPIAEANDPELVATLDERFSQVFDLLATYGSEDQGFVGYSTLSEDQVRELSRAIEALSEPLSHLTATVLL